jgi:uncharacterized protein YgbK (DUF1537 family)
MLLGCIADDLTGASDLALMLSKEGMRTVQSTGLPSPDLDLSEADALVVALKSRSIPAPEAVALSLAAARAMRALGASRLLFKYCSTFDSTDAGNIGPVTRALLDEVGGGPTIACPAFPRAGRTIYQGHLFVGDRLLSDSPMRDHPLNPMRDPDLRRVLARQMHEPIGLIDVSDVERGPPGIAAALAREASAGRPVAIVDALTDRHLRGIGSGLADLPLLTGGSGIAMGLPEAYHDRGLLPVLTPPPTAMVAPEGRAAVLAGSCSAATREQVSAFMAAGFPAFRIDADRLADGSLPTPEILAWVDGQPTDRPILIFSSADPETVGRIQARLGRDTAGALVEDALAAVAQGLVMRGFTRLLVAGGETSGAVVQALGAKALSIGPEIDPGVPWTRSRGSPDLALALKSGNFGSPDFFLKAWTLLA